MALPPKERRVTVPDIAPQTGYKCTALYFMEYFCNTAGRHCEGGWGFSVTLTQNFAELLADSRLPADLALRLLGRESRRADR